MLTHHCLMKPTTGLQLSQCQNSANWTFHDKYINYYGSPEMSNNSSSVVTKFNKLHLYKYIKFLIHMVIILKECEFQESFTSNDYTLSNKTKFRILKHMILWALEFLIHKYKLCVRERVERERRTKTNPLYSGLHLTVHVLEIHVTHIGNQRS